MGGPCVPDSAVEQLWVLLDSALCFLLTPLLAFCAGRYVDTALQLLERAGDYVSDDIWQRVVQLVTNNESMQQYAARNLIDVLKRGATHEVGLPSPTDCVRRPGLRSLPIKQSCGAPPPLHHPHAV